MARKILILLFLGSMILVAGCDVFSSGHSINVTIIDAADQKQISVPSSSIVKNIIDQAGIVLTALDRTEPSTTTILTDDTTITITRVTEEYEVEQAIVPFEQQTVKNESLPEGQTVLIQAGENGIQQNTYRILFENGIEVSRTFVSSEITIASKPEIVMVGVQSPFTPQQISGVIAYISSSNAWLMEGNTGNRRPVVSTGDLDGRIFSLSPDREWLLFSRTSEKEGEINTLWIVNLADEVPEPIETNISNVVNYADWVPGRSRTFSFSTVEPVPTSPGWSANNDLRIYRFDQDGNEIDTELVVDTNTGGISGWWGTSYEWSTNGSKLAYARPDSIGLVDLDTGALNSIMDFEVYNTGSDWAWVPGIKWAANDEALYTVLIPNPENNTGQNPALSVITFPENQVINLVSNCGLFCYPIPSPLLPDFNFSVAFLYSIIPDQSENSSYSLKTMDRDGSNQIKFYPGEGVQGLSPQTLKWSPNWPEDHLIAAVAQNDMIFVDTETGAIKKITGDGSISKIDWK